MRAGPASRRVLGALLVVAACGTVELPPGATRIDTLESGVVRTRSAAAPEASDTLVPALEIDGWGRVRGIEILADGGLLVLDDLAHAVTRFDRAGAALWTFGREGQGPGEFRTPLGVVVGPAGRAWIPDPGNRRWVVLSPRGVLVEEPPRPIVGASDWRGVFVDDHRLLHTASVRLEQDEPMFVPAWLVGHPGRPEQDTVRVPYQPFPTFRSRPESEGSGAFLEPTVPFTARLEVEPDARGFLWVADGGRSRVARVDLDGDTVGLIDSDHVPPEVTRHEADSALGRLREQFPQARRILRRRRLPDRHPHITDLLSDGERLWVRRFARGDRTTFEVFGPDGRSCGALALDGRIDDRRARVRHGRLAGVAARSSGAPVVRVYDVGDPCAAPRP